MKIKPNRRSRQFLKLTERLFPRCMAVFSRAEVLFCTMLCQCTQHAKITILLPPTKKNNTVALFTLPMNMERHGFGVEKILRFFLALDRYNFF